MKYLLSIFFMIVSILFVVSCLSSLKDGKTQVSISCRECSGMDVSLTRSSDLPLAPLEVHRSKFDSLGRARIEFKQEDTLNVLLVFGEFKYITPMHLEPGSNIDLTIENGTFNFNGDLKIINSYYNKISLTVNEGQKYVNANYAKRISASYLEQQAHLDSLKIFGAELKKQIESDNSISTHYREIIMEYFSLFEISQRLYFDTQVDINDIVAKGRSIVLDSTLSNAFNNFSLLDNYMKYPYYTWYLHKRVEPIFNNILNYRYENSIKTGEYEYIKRGIVRDRKLDDYQELLMAIFIAQTSNSGDMDYEAGSKLINLFQKDFPKSKYLRELNYMLTGFSGLRSGMPIKDLSMHDDKGKVFELSDLKGNLVYIDIWATWCGPCVDELEYSKKLSKKYSTYPDLKFLYVSIDQDTEKWKKFLKENSQIKGLHGIQNSEIVADSNLVTSLYKFGAIPRYIIIDKNGNIVTANAKRPSELVSNNYLDSLLSL
ncbi:TlpA family protein disulfide reductase [Dyadobacter psychrotolerans]|uniref:TlpA family protein disulfide reductase n=1 Tax=Dyadobacter psychrotolerans TaxID=2541721 RepID=A0A4R5DRY6_9BACT|nr:TlpA disulfide reductase family protein [Dyadobacter psychrotolerans]TDE14821.1 TlpA family protein disulfide reductase [Dyadobacter psychrotolerans]